MRINADYSQRVVELPEDAQWRASPAPGVERRMLDRVGEETAVATSVVRYAPGSRFPTHVHTRGEEFFVLEGTFSDASGDYSAGSYVRNPDGTSHAPWTDDGTVILVKLRQFQDEDLTQFSIDTTAATWQSDPRSGGEMLKLHACGTETVQMLRLQAGMQMPAHDCEFGEERYVVSGVIEEQGARCAAGSWIRTPSGKVPSWQALEDSTVWLKSGHLHPQHGPDRRNW